LGDERTVEREDAGAHVGGPVADAPLGPADGEAEEVEMGERLGAVEPHVGPSGVAGGMPGAGGSAEPARGEEAGEEVEEAVLAARHMDDLGGARAVAGE